MIRWSANDREEARHWASDLLERGDWVVLDTETTGLDTRAQAIQIAIASADGATLLNTLVRPIGRIPPEAIAIHGITDAMVVDAPTFPEVHPTLAEILHGKIVIAYNAAFDRRILRQTALLNRARELPLTWQCAMEQYSRFVGRWSDRHGSYAWQPLPRPPEYAARKHQAIDDCLATLDVIRKMADWTAR
jgi:DNA polymerase-3 subunit epsilon